ncbi:MAG TPA: hypothetical protein DEA73_04515 [Peptococcaceae bacterium]|nr:hypothetical protein [Peptococcaceae bacterium]
MTRGFFYLMVILVVFSTLLEIAFFDPHHVYFPWYLPGFDALIGFIGCTAIIFFAKGLGKRFLQRQETYYEEEEENILKKVMVGNHD